MNDFRNINELQKIIKSILVSSPVKLRVYELNQEHKKLIGTNIPYEEFGYSTLVQFLNSMSVGIKVNGNDMFSTIDVNKDRMCHIKRSKKRKKGKKKAGTNIKGQTQIQTALKREPHKERDRNLFLVAENQEKPKEKFFHHDIKNYSSSPVDGNNIVDTDNGLIKPLSPQKLNAAKQTLIKQPQMSTAQSIGKLFETKQKKKEEIRCPKSSLNLKKSEAIPMSNNLLERRKMSLVSRRLKLCTIDEGDPSDVKAPKELIEFSRAMYDKCLLTQKITSAKVNLTSIDIWKRDIDEPVPSTSILDEPIPINLPEVPKEFSKVTDDLIDLDCAISNIPFIEKNKVERIIGKKNLPFIEVLRMVKQLELGDSK